MDTEDVAQWLSERESTQDSLIKAVSQYLTVEEAAQIIRQFQSDEWAHNGQLLWSGVPLAIAEEWAHKHNLQTLSAAMGPLMRENHPNCLKSKKSQHQWSQYMRGASAIFAWHIARGETVTMLSPPPPERFHPSWPHKLSGDRGAGYPRTTWPECSAPDRHGSSNSERGRGVLLRTMAS